MIRKTAVIIAIGAAALAFVTFGGTSQEKSSPQPASAPAAEFRPSEDPYIAWWTYANTSPDVPARAVVEDPYVAWWKFATTSQDVVAP